MCLEEAYLEIKKSVLYSEAVGVPRPVNKTCYKYSTTSKQPQLPVRLRQAAHLPLLGYHRHVPDMRQPAARVIVDKRARTRPVQADSRTDRDCRRKMAVALLSGS